MAQIKFQAREIFRAAKRNGIDLKQNKFEKCAIGVICKVEHLPCHENRKKIADRINVDHTNLIALEMGFEGWTVADNCLSDDEFVARTDESRKILENAMKNRYYKVGRNLAKMAGLP